VEDGVSIRVLPVGGEQLLTKQQLARHLGRSTRWVELKMREGMPSLEPTTRFPGRRYRLRDVEAWLAAGERAQPRDRVARLEAEVARLRSIVEQLQRGQARWRS
jgi:hypothetical protein